MKPLITTALFLSATVLVCQDVQQQNVSAADVIHKMLLRDTEREAESGGYSGTRHYILENERLHKAAELVAVVRCGRDGAKRFEVVSEAGWSAANNHVLRKMLESETETSSPAVRPKARLTPENYNFSLVTRELVDGRPAYVIDVIPNRHDKFLMEGRIWVDASDYALVRAEGRPAHNPSLWTRSLYFVQRYQKSGAYWFPISTESITEARLFGRTHVNIAYSNYVPNAEISSSFQQMSMREINHAIH